jgi:hypothetical protein
MRPLWKGGSAGHRSSAGFIAKTDELALAIPSANLALTLMAPRTKGEAAPVWTIQESVGTVIEQWIAIGRGQ